MTRHHSCRVSPFGHPRINARLAAPRGLSQPPTSFIGSQCQGIHHAPLNTYKHKTNIRNCTSENNHHTPPTPSRKRKPAAHGCCSLDARNHYPRIKHHTPHHQRWSDNNPPPTGAQPLPVPQHTGQRSSGLVVSKPNSVSDDQSLPSQPEDQPLNPGKRLLCTRTGAHYRAGPSNESLSSPNSHRRGRGMSLVVLLRKEVIQPHLPVRLPCYDFVPIADPTFDGSLPCGLGHRLRVLPTFMT